MVQVHVYHGKHNCEFVVKPNRLLGMNKARTHDHKCDRTEHYQ